MSMQTITERELVENGVSSLPLTPTASPALGGRDYTPSEVKAAFDRLPRLIAARLNALLGAVTDGTLLADIPVAFGDGTLSLSELLALLGDHLVNPPAPDSAPASESENTVTSGGIYAALAALRKEVLSAAKTATDSALRAQKLRYDAATGVLSLAAEEGSAAFDSASLPIPGMQETLALLRTLLGASVLSETVEDTFTTRPTAGGLAVVDEAPTTVHKIIGDTETSVNLVDLADAVLSSESVHGVSVTADHSRLTFTGTADQSSWFSYTARIDLDRYIGKTLTFSQSPFFTSSTASGAAFWLFSVDNQARSTNANATGTLTVTLEPGHTYSASIRSGEGGAIDETISFMVNEGATARAYSDYYAGVKHAAFRGIGSSGRNLLHHIRTDSVTLNGITMTMEPEEGTVSFSGTVAGGDFRARVTQTPFYLPRGQYTFYLPRRVQGLSWYLVNSSGVTVAGLSWTNATKSVAVTIDREGSYYIDVLSPDGKGVSLDYTETPMILCGTVTENFPAFETYRTDTSFALATPVTLGKWDTIDVDAQKQVVGTVTETQDTPYTEEQLAQFDEYILSADGKTVAYRTAAPTETALSLPKTYQAWHGGCEYITKDAAGGQNSDDLKLTVNQDYYVKAGGENA